MSRQNQQSLRICLITVVVALCSLTGCDETAERSQTSKTAKTEEMRAPVPRMEFSIEGEMGFVQGITNIQKTGDKIISISRSDPPRGASGIGGFLQMPGPHKLNWSPKQGETYDLTGKVFIGIRKDSPEQYDVAFVVDSLTSVPHAILAYKSTVIALNQDSVFLQPKFRELTLVVWLCKIKYVGKRGYYIDWSRQPSDETQEPRRQSGTSQHLAPSILSAGGG